MSALIAHKTSSASLLSTAALVAYGAIQPHVGPMFTMVADPIKDVADQLSSAALQMIIAPIAYGICVSIYKAALDAIISPVVASIPFVRRVGKSGTQVMSNIAMAYVRYNRFTLAVAMVICVVSFLYGYAKPTPDRKRSPRHCHCCCDRPSPKKPTESKSVATSTVDQAASTKSTSTSTADQVPSAHPSPTASVVETCGSTNTGNGKPCGHRINKETGLCQVPRHNIGRINRKTNIPFA